MNENIKSQSGSFSGDIARERLTLAGRDYLVDVEIKRAVVGALAAARKEGSAKAGEKYLELERELSQKNETVAALQLQLQSKEQAERAAQLFFEAKLNYDLCFALKEYELFSLEQTIKVILSVGKARVIEEDGEFRTAIHLACDGELREINLDDYIAEFLAMPQNAILLRDKLRGEKNRKKVAS